MALSWSSLLLAALLSVVALVLQGCEGEGGPVNFFVNGSRVVVCPAGCSLTINCPDAGVVSRGCEHNKGFSLPMYRGELCTQVFGGVPALYNAMCYQFMSMINRTVMLRSGQYVPIAWAVDVRTGLSGPGR